jgi:putative membrane protein
MSLLLSILVLIVALEHLFIMWLEITVPSPRAARAFNISLEKLQQPEIRTLFANQGLYNGFLAAGLIWSLIWSLFAAPELARPLQAFFLGCVISAALFGAYTSSKKILWVQGAPALLAFLVWLVV